MPRTRSRRRISRRNRRTRRRTQKGGADGAYCRVTKATDDENREDCYRATAEDCEKNENCTWIGERTPEEAKKCPLEDEMNTYPAMMTNGRISGAPPGEMKVGESRDGWVCLPNGYYHKKGFELRGSPDFQREMAALINTATNNAPNWIGAGGGGRRRRSARKPRRKRRNSRKPKRKTRKSRRRRRRK